MQKASLQSECSHDQVRGHQTACETRLTVGEGETPVPHRKAHICRATPVPCDAIRNPASHAHRVSRQTAGERAEQSRADQSRSVLHCHDLQATDAKFNGLAVTWPLRSPEAFAVAQIRAVAHCCPSTTLITASNGHHLPNRALRPTMVGPNARVCSTRPARSRRPLFRFARSSWVLLSENIQQR